MRKDFRRISFKAISFVLTVIMVLSLLPLNAGLMLNASASVNRNGEERTVVIASSDYQFPNVGMNLIYSQYTQVIGNLSDDAGAHAVVENILGKMAADGVTEADGVLHCGDFDYDLPTQGTHGIESYRDAISSVIDPDDPDHVVIMGNHDQNSNAYFAKTTEYILVLLTYSLYNKIKSENIGEKHRVRAKCLSPVQSTFPPPCRREKMSDIISFFKAM